MSTDVYNKKIRNSRKRKLKKVLLISVEGLNKTERLYFKDFESKFFRIKFVRSNASDPIRMMNELKNEYKNSKLSVNKGDIGVSLVDSDFDKNKNILLRQADKVSLKHLIQIVSSPCFEIWFLCHFRSSSKQYNSQDELIEELKKYIPNYEKSTENLYEQLKDKTNIAIENAEKLYKYCIEKYGKDKKHNVDFAPSTEVFKVVKLLKYDTHIDK